MTDSKPSIIFMGTPDFAVSSLNRLLDNNFNIKAVVTSTDKPAGRGRKLMFSDIKNFAVEKNLLLLQPEKLKSEDFINRLKSLNADLFVVVAFRMLPKEVWQIPKMGTINLHSSILPDYRGAAPINHAIINGETKTGVTTFFINENIDTGNIIMKRECEITPEDNFGSLHDKLKETGADLLVETINILTEGNIKTISQNINDDTIKYAPKISKEFCRINWGNKAECIHNLIRGLSPYPTAFTELNGNILKIYRSSYQVVDHKLKPGKFISDNKSYIKVATPDGFIQIEELQISGKKRMNVKDFLNGYKFD